MSGRALVRGLVAGVAGVAVMTSVEKIEQLLTHRPNSYVPAKTLARLLGRKPERHAHDRALNWTMHWGRASCWVPLGDIWPSRVFVVRLARSCS